MLDASFTGIVQKSVAFRQVDGWLWEADGLEGDARGVPSHGLVRRGRLPAEGHGVASVCPHALQGNFMELQDLACVQVPLHLRFTLGGSVGNSQLKDLL